MRNFIIFIIAIFVFTNFNVNAQEIKGTLKQERIFYPIHALGDSAAMKEYEFEATPITFIIEEIGKLTGWNFSSVTFLTGRTPLIGGNTATVAFTKGKSVLSFDFNSQLGEYMYFYYPKPWFSIGHSSGFFKNTVFTGPIGTLEFGSKSGFHFNSLHWLGFSAGDPEEESTKAEANFLFNYHQANFSYKGITVYYAWQQYQENPVEHLIGTKITMNLNDHWSGFGGWAYMTQKGGHLWSIGATFKL